MLEILNLMVHQSLGNLREKKNLICSSVCYQLVTTKTHLINKVYPSQSYPTNQDSAQWGKLGGHLDIVILSNLLSHIC